MQFSCSTHFSPPITISTNEYSTSVGAAADFTPSFSNTKTDPTLCAIKFDLNMEKTMMARSSQTPYLGQQDGARETYKAMVKHEYSKLIPTACL